MIVPRFWAEARKQGKVARRKVTVRRFGWSDGSQAEAEQNAQRRVEEAFARIEAGESLYRREFKRAYNGADGVPIREEILERFGDAILTRNVYGAQCLNTPDVFFADVDFGSGPGFAIWSLVMGAISIVAFASFFLGSSLKSALVLEIVGLVFSYPIARVLQKCFLGFFGGEQAWALWKIRRFLAHRPDWNLRIYRTPAGLRLLAMHSPMEPGSDETAKAFQSLGTDPIYVRMCRRQQCFRARVSPKPWRIEPKGQSCPIRGAWPVAEGSLLKRQLWVQDYETRSMRYASCQFLKELGSGNIDPRVRSLQLIHDQLCRADSQLPLA